MKQDDAVEEKSDAKSDAVETGQHQIRMLRLFVAIPLNDSIREELTALIGRLQTGFQFTPCRPSWCRPETIHITLAFLGKQPETKVREIEKRLAVVTNEFSPLKIEIKKLGVFPDWHNPKILWAGLRDRSHQIEALHNRIEDCLEAIGYQPEKRKYNPHLTLARFKSLKGVSIARNLVQNHGQYKLGPYEAPEIVLFKSELDPAGAIHTPMCRICLQKRP